MDRGTTVVTGVVHGGACSRALSRFRAHAAMPTAFVTALGDVQPTSRSVCKLMSLENEYYCLSEGRSGRRPPAETVRRERRALTRSTPPVPRRTACARLRDLSKLKAERERAARVRAAR